MSSKDTAQPQDPQEQPIPTAAIDDEELEDVSGGQSTSSVLGVSSWGNGERN
jgi:hypothetical protein